MLVNFTIQDFIIMKILTHPSTISGSHTRFLQILKDLSEIALSARHSPVKALIGLGQSCILIKNKYDCSL